MKIIETPLAGAFELEIQPIEDERGFFARGFCAKELEQAGMNPKIAQANISYNKQKGILRGLHYQISPYEEAKLVRCIRGAVWDVIVDLRKDSPTYKRWHAAELRADKHNMLYVPEGFAHGYLVLEDHSELFYSSSEFYTPGAEQGLRWDDKTFDIDWPIKTDLLISDKDQEWPEFDA